MKKKIFFGILLVAIVILCVNRWNTWFGNPPEPDYDIQHHPDRIMLTVGPDENSRYLSWQYDSIAQPGCVDYVESDGTDTLTVMTQGVKFRSRSGVGAYFSALMDSLKMGSSYRYRIRVGVDTSDWFSFRMSDCSERFSFLYFGDIQDDMDETGFDSLMPKVMETNPDASFLLFGGDLIERPMDQYWGKVFGSLSPFCQTTPVVAVPGNHEYLKGVVRKLESRFTLFFPYFNVSSPTDNALFSFKRGDARFFLLDSNKDFWKLFSQRSWLKEQLSQCEEKWKIVVLHHPLISVRGATNNLFVRLMFDDLVRDAGVDLVLQGHEHAYARFHVNRSEEDDSEPLRLVSYCSRKDYPLSFHGDVEKWGTDDRYFQRISISQDTLSLEAFGSDVQLYDKVSIVKKNGTRTILDNGATFKERVRVSEWFRKHKSAKKVREYEKSIEEWRKSRVF